MTFFFDNNLPRAISLILSTLDVDATHLKDHFPENTLDIEWLPEIGRRGWVLITADRTIPRAPAERLALRQAGIISFFFGRWFLRRQKWEQAQWILKYWRVIEETAGKAQPGTSYQVTRSCKFTRLAL